MAALNNAHLSLLNVVTRMLPDGSVDEDIVELLMKYSPTIRDAVWVEGNEMSGHRSHVRTSLPTPSWRKLNQVSSFDKSTTAPITDSIGICEKWFQIDAKMVRMQANPAGFLKSEHDAFVEAFAQEIEDTVYNGNESTAPEEFTGILPRYNVLATSSTDQQAEQMFTEAGAGDTDAASIVLVDWSPKRVHMLYPRGSGGGLEVYDEGLVTSENHAGQVGPLQVFRKKFCWDAGLHVKDWRGISRFQFDPDDVVASGATGPVISDFMGKMISRVQPGPNARFYMGRTARECFDLQANNKGVLAVTSVTTALGEVVEAFRGIPIRRTDALPDTETAIV
jgi:hypothetical protein